MKRFIYEHDILTDREREVFERVRASFLVKMTNADAQELFFIVDRLRKEAFLKSEGKM
jgi:hypothetical protein